MEKRQIKPEYRGESTEAKEYYARQADRDAKRQEQERQERLNKSIGELGTRDEVIKDIDELLDEIDEVLEENAEQFVASYIQKGGE